VAIDQSAQKPDWASGYEAGYRLGYKHGQQDARKTEGESRPTPDSPDAGDVSRVFGVGLSVGNLPERR